MFTTLFKLLVISEMYLTLIVSNQQLFQKKNNKKTLQTTNSTQLARI